MIAREMFPFHSARLHAPSRLPSKSFISPTYANFTSNSFVSPTYAKTGGCTPHKNVGLSLAQPRGAPTFTLSFLPISTLGSLLFQSLAHSFVFRITPISHRSITFCTLLSKTRVYPPWDHLCKISPASEG